MFNNLLPEDSWALRSLEMSAVKTCKGGCLGFSGGGEGTLHKSSSTDPVALGMVTTSWWKQPREREPADGTCTTEGSFQINHSFSPSWIPAQSRTTQTITLAMFNRNRGNISLPLCMHIHCLSLPIPLQTSLCSGTHLVLSFQLYKERNNHENGATDAFTPIHHMKQ